MILNQVKALLEPYLYVDSSDPSSKLESQGLTTFRGRNLRGSPLLDSYISVLGGCECADFIVGDLTVAVHPLSLLSLRAKNSSTSDENTGLLVELKSVRFKFREKGESWLKTKGGVETLDLRIGILDGLRQAMHDSVVLEQFQHDSTVSSSVKWLISKVSRNVKIQLSDITIDFFPESSQESLTLHVGDILIADSNADPCADEGFGHVQGPSVFRKQLVIRDIQGFYKSTQFLSLETFEILLALNLSTEAKGLCTALEIRLGDCRLDLEKISYARLMRIPERMAVGVTVEERAQRMLSDALRELPPVTTGDKAKILEIYERVLESEDPYADKALQPAVKGSNLQDTALAHPVSWLHLVELQIGEAEVNNLLKEAAENIRTRRARDVLNAPTVSPGRWLERFRRNEPKPISQSDQVAVLEALNLVRQDPAKIRLVFDSLDLDGSGAVDVIELQRGLENCGLNLGTHRVMALMKEIDTSSDGQITLEEFRYFLANIDQVLLEQESSVVSVGIAVYLHRINVTLRPAVRLTLSGVQVSANSSGMPYSRRHDVSVGFKKVSAKVQGINMDSLRTSSPILSWGKRQESVSADLNTRTTLRFVEFNPVDSETSQKQFTKPVRVLVSYGEKEQSLSHVSVPACFDEKLARFEFERKGESLVNLKIHRGENANQGTTVESLTNNYYCRLVIDTRKGQDQRSFLSRLIGLGGGEEATVDGERFVVLGEIDLKIAHPSRSSVEFSRDKRIVHSNERWVALVTEGGSKVGDLLVRVKTEAWFDLPEHPFAQASRNDELVQHSAVTFKLAHSPGIQVSDMAIAVKASGLVLDYTKEAATALNELAVVTAGDAASTPALKDAANTVQKTPTVAPPTAESSPNPQQVASPGDLFGFTSYTTDADQSPTVPSLLRSSIKLDLFPFSIRLEKDPEALEALHMDFIPCSMVVYTNGGCSKEVNLFGIPEDDDREAGSPRMARHGDTKSVGGDSYVTAYDGEQGDEEAGTDIALNRSFHGKLHIGSIGFDVFTLSNRLSKGQQRKVHRSSFSIDSPSAKVEMKLDPQPTFLFYFAIKEILFADIVEDHNLMCQYYAVQRDTKPQITLSGEYNPHRTFLEIGLNGLCIFATPLAAALMEILDNVPQAVGTSSTEETMARKPETESRLEAPEAADIAQQLVLPTERIDARLNVSWVEIFLLDSVAIGEAKRKEKFRVLCLRSRAKGDVEVRAHSGSAQPLHEKVDVLITSEIVRLNLKYASNVNRLVDPFRIAVGFSTSAIDVGPQTVASKSLYLADVVERAVDRQWEENDVNTSYAFRSAAPPTIVQEIAVVLDGGFNARLDSSDFQFCSIALGKLTEAITPSEVSTQQQDVQVPPPPVQSLATHSDNDADNSVWSIMTALYPLLVLAPVSDERERPAETRKRLAKQATEAYKSSSKVPPLQKFELRLSHGLIGIAVLGEAGFPTPFVRMHVQEVELTLKSLSGTWFARGVVGEGHVSIECQTFNTVNFAWEPLLEPWTMRSRIAVTMEGENMILLTADSRLNINITESVVFNLAKFSAFIDPSVQPPREDGRLKGAYCPNWIVNETGEDIKVWPIRRKEDLELSDNSFEIQANRVSRIHLRDRRLLYESGQRLIRRYIAANLKLARRRKEDLSAWTNRPNEVILREIFERIDRDNSGTLSVSELQRALASQDEIMPRDQLEYEIEVATGKPLAETGVTAEDFASFFSGSSESSPRSQELVNSLAVCMPNIAENKQDLWLCPPNVSGVYLLPCLERKHKEGSEVFGHVEKMGRLVMSSVVRLETRIKIENRLPQYRLVVGYYESNSAGTNSEDAFVPVLDIRPGVSKCIPLRFFRSPVVTDFFARAIPLESDSSMTERYESTKVLSVGAGHPDVPIRPMRMVKKTRIQSKEQLYSVLRFGGRDEDLLDSELVDATLIRADRVEFSGGVEFICSERTVQSHQYESRPIITLNVISGQKLLAKDYNGLSDPYVIVTAGPETYRTETVASQLNPRWPDKSSTFLVGQHCEDGLPGTITLKVMDEDRFGPHDEIGSVVLQVNDLIGEFSAVSGRTILRTYDLVDPKGKPAGSITVGMKYEPLQSLKLPSDVQQRIVAFSPTITIENLLPIALQFAMKSNKGKEEVYVLAEGRSHALNPFYDGAKACTDAFEIRLRVDDSDAWTLLDSLDRPIVIDSAKGTFIINSDLLREKDGTWRLIVFADWWIANKVGPHVDLSLEISPIGSGINGELLLTESFLPNVRTKYVRDEAIMAVSLPVKKRNKDKKEVVVRARMRVGGDNETGVVSADYVSVRPTSKRLTALPIPWAIDLEDSTIHANEGVCLLQLESQGIGHTGFFDAFSRYGKPAEVRRPVLAGDLLVIVRRLNNTGEEYEPKHVRIFSLDETLPLSRVGEGAYVLANVAHIKDFSNYFIEVVSSQPVPSPQIWTIPLTQFLEAQLADKHVTESWGYLERESNTTLARQTLPTAESTLQVGAFLHNALPKASDGSSRLRYERLSVGGTSLYNKWFRTRLITFAPMFTIAKEKGCAFQILVKAHGASDDEAIFLDDQPRSVRFCDPQNPAVQFRLASSPNSCWTRPVPLMHDHDFAIQLRDENGNRAERFLFDINRSGPSRCVVVRISPPETTRIIIQNSTQRSVEVRQVFRPPKRSLSQVVTCSGRPTLVAGNSGQIRCGESEEFPWDDLRPGQILPLGFDIFEDVANPTDVDEKDSVRVPRLNIRIEEHPTPLTCDLRDGYTNKKCQGVLVQVEFRGVHLVVDITEAGANSNQTSQAQASPTGSTTPASSGETTGVTNFIANFSGFGISLFSTTRQREILYLLIQRVHFESSTFTRMEHDVGEGTIRAWTTSRSEVSIGKMQIDSSLPNARYPVTLTSAIQEESRRKKQIISSALGKRAKSAQATDSENEHVPAPIVTRSALQWAKKFAGEEARVRRAKEGFFRLVSDAAYPAEHPDAVIYKNVEATIRSLDVRLDEVFLGGVLSVLLAQSDASAFSNANIGDYTKTSTAELLKPDPNDSLLIKASFFQDLELPPRDSSFVESALITGWTVSLTVRLGSPAELIPVAKRYGIPANLLVVAIRLSRLEALLFDLPQYPERAVGSEKIAVKYQALLMGAFWEQLGEVLLNFVKRMLMSVGIFRRLPETEKMRMPPGQAEVLEPYGPGALPSQYQALKEMAAIRRIEDWWARRKRARELEAQGVSPPPPPASSHGNKLRSLFSTISGGDVSGKKKTTKKKGVSCLPWN